MNSAYFMRKPMNITELKECTLYAIKHRQNCEKYRVRKTISLSSQEYKHFIDNLFEDFDFLKEYTDLCDPDMDGYINCLAVKNRETGERILVNTEGYDYARYAALMPGSSLDQPSQSNN